MPPASRPRAADLIWRGFCPIMNLGPVPTRRNCSFIKGEGFKAKGRHCLECGLGAPLCLLPSTSFMRFSGLKDYTYWKLSSLFVKRVYYELYEWVESLLDRADLMKPECFTFDPVSRPKLPRYELLAAAAVIVTMKFLFGLDDKTEWDLSSGGSGSETGSVFSLRRWYRLLQQALLRAQERKRQHTARKQWVPKKPLYFNKEEKSIVMKRRRVAEQLRSCFERLSSHCHGDPQKGGPCSFHFLWGQSPGADGPSMYHMTLEGGARTNQTKQTTDQTKYWHPPLRRCSRCRSHYSSVEPTLPRMFVWILQLFCFLLDVAPSSLYEEVLNVERRVLGSRMPRTPQRKRRKKSTLTTEKTGQMN